MRAIHAKPQLVRELVAQGGKLLAEFARRGIRMELICFDLGITSALTEYGDPYFDVVQNTRLTSQA